MNVVAFQKHFVLTIYNGLEYRFENNHIVATLKVLDLTNMPSRRVGLANWEVVVLELLCGQ